MKADTVNSTFETNPVRALAHSSAFSLGMLLVSHPILALAMKSSPLIATAHAFLVLSIGVWLAIFGKDLRRLSFVAAYIAGAEVLWRMTDAQIFWEAGKYFSVFILGLALLRIRPWRQAGVPIVYFLLLCLSIPLTMMNLQGDVRGEISFNLSGPLALSMCALYFSQIRLDSSNLRSIAWWMIFPILSIATLTFSSTLTADQIIFYDESNFITSGGFGPNQVSAMLGLGAALLLLVFLTGKKAAGKLTSLALGLTLVILSGLTLSRGGLYNAAVVLALALVHFLRSTRGRIAGLLILLAAGIAGGYLVFPRLNNFTEGMLEQRFRDLNLSYRGEIAQADLSLWAANPLFGVGPGLSTYNHAFYLGFMVAPHTEYTRILAEHGAAGLLALLLILFMAARRYLRAPSVESRMWIAVCVGWPLMEMSHAAMRMVTISFLFGLAMVQWDQPVPKQLLES